MEQFSVVKSALQHQYLTLVSLTLTYDPCCFLSLHLLCTASSLASPDHYSVYVSGKLFKGMLNNSKTL